MLDQKTWTLKMGNTTDKALDERGRLVPSDDGIFVMNEKDAIEEAKQRVTHIRFYLCTDRKVINFDVLCPKCKEIRQKQEKITDLLNDALIFPVMAEYFKRYFETGEK